MDHADVVIIGGGVIGCALAMELAMRPPTQRRAPDIFLVEAMPHLGMASSTRNSGVIHSGVYYTPGSLKARLCVDGSAMLYEFCQARGVPHRRTGKLVVAEHENAAPVLEQLAAQGHSNGVNGLEVVGRAAIQAHEPHVAGVAALWIPSAGIVAADELVKALARVARDSGANFVTHARVVALQPCSDGVRVTCEIGTHDGAGGRNKIAGDVAREAIIARCLVNCAGLYADEVAAMLGFPKYRIYPVRGEYCELVRNRTELVRGLVYPLPHAQGMSLGVHLTRTVWGTVLVGTTARYVEDKEDYESNRLPIEEFVRMARPLLPELQASDLRLAYSGLRAKLVPPRDSAGTEPAAGAADFVIMRDPQVAAAIHLIGMESPGLTSSLAIARYVAPMVAETLESKA